MVHRDKVDCILSAANPILDLFWQTSPMYLCPFLDKNSFVQS